ncbi:hypothetical protein AD998_12810 [bacterium 336/3]|nr:hypothetical protein AD998_12810 [bacterium 336/3]
MLKITKKIIWNILNFLKLGAYVQLTLKSGLKDEGWFKSFYTKQSVDNHKKPIPWFTYSAIHFLQNRLKPHFDIFEYGCGNSTLWLAERVKSVDAVEGDKNWVEYLRPKMPKTVTITYHSVQEDENGKYAQAIAETSKLYDIVIVDGRDRNHCIIQSEKYLKEGGIIILDNSDRPDYQKGTDFLNERGYKRIDFVGNTPIVAMNSSTTIFYQPNNCLEI